MKIGLIGEAPLDTLSIKCLLSKKFPNLEYIELLKNKFTGCSLENQKTKTEIRIECITHRPDIVIFIRDLDGLATPYYRDKILLRKTYFNDFKGSTLCKKTIYLLHIWEIESLIFSDLNAFNKFYDTDLQQNLISYHIENPKEELYKLHRKYSNSDNLKIFEYSNFDTIYNENIYFKKFIDEFQKLI